MDSVLCSSHMPAPERDFSSHLQVCFVFLEKGGQIPGRLSRMSPSPLLDSPKNKAAQTHHQPHTASISPSFRRQGLERWDKPYTGVLPKASSSQERGPTLGLGRLCRPTMVCQNSSPVFVGPEASQETRTRSHASCRRRCARLALGICSIRGSTARRICRAGHYCIVHSAAGTRHYVIPPELGVVYTSHSSVSHVLR